MLQQVKAEPGGKPGCGFIPELDASKTRCFCG